MKLTPVDGGKKTSVEKIGCLHNTIESFDSHTFTFLPGGDSRDSVSVSVSIPFHFMHAYITSSYIKFISRITYSS